MFDGVVRQPCQDGKTAVNYCGMAARVTAFTAWNLSGEWSFVETQLHDRQRITEWIRFACDRNCVPELARVIVVEWNRRFTRRLGDGGYNLRTKGARIRLSIPLWPRTSEQERRETVIHEACHCIVGFKHGQVARPHGGKWKQAMGACGVRPLRTHNVDRTGLARRQRRFILLDCPNEGRENKCRINAWQHNLLRHGKKMWCKVCGLNLNRHSSLEIDSATEPARQ
jgi:SprT protein